MGFHHSVVTHEPGHVSTNSVWWNLFPKKLNTSCPYHIADGSDDTIATNGTNETWCIHIIEEFHTFAVVSVCLLIFVSGGVLGIIYSAITSDAGAGFMIAAFFDGTAAVPLTCLQLSDYKSV